MTELTSIQELWQEVQGSIHHGLADILKSHTYVGMVSEISLTIDS